MLRHGRRRPAPTSSAGSGAAPLRQGLRLTRKPRLKASPLGRHLQGRFPLLRPSASAAAPPQEGAARAVAQEAAGAAAAQRQGQVNKDAVLRLFAALNRRDIEDMLAQLAPDCWHHDLSPERPPASQGPAALPDGGNKLAIANLFATVLSSFNRGTKFVIEDVIEGDPYTVGGWRLSFQLPVSVSWHLEVEGVEVPFTRGVSFYRVDAAGRICYIHSSPEQFVRAAALAGELSWLNAAEPVLRLLGPAATPQYWTHVLREAASQAVRDVVSPLPEPFGHAIMSFVESAAPAISGAGGPSLLGLPGWTPSSSSGSAVPSSGITLPPQVFAFTDGPAPPRHAHAEGYTVTLPPQVAPLPPVHGAAEGAAAAPAADHDSSAGHSSSSRQGHGGAGLHGIAIRMRELKLKEEAPPAAVTTSTSRAEDAGRPAAAAAAVAVAVTAAAAPSTVAAPSTAAAPSVQPAAPEQPAAPPSFTPSLSGIWVKDAGASQLDEYERALDLWQISGMQKATARLIEGLELQHVGNKLTVQFLTIIPYFKVTENYTVGGQCKIMRRDLRPGQATATAAQLGAAGVKVCVSWGEPIAGGLEESYVEVAPGELHVTSKIIVGSRSATTTQVYCRQNISRSEFLKASEQRNGSAQKVLAGFGFGR